MRKVEIKTEALADRGVTVTLSGDLVRSQAKYMKEELSNIIDDYDSIHLQVKTVENLDLSCVQLLIAARKMAHAHYKPLTITRELSTELETILLHAGFTEF